MHVDERQDAQASAIRSKASRSDQIATACFVAVTLAGLLASGKAAKDARAYLFIGPTTRISPVMTAPDERPHARSEITIEPIATFAQVDMAQTPLVECEPPTQRRPALSLYPTPPRRLPERGFFM